MIVNFPKSKLLRNILTNYVFSFLFWKEEKIKDGDILCIEDDLFEFDDYNGNINTLKHYYHINGFWNYIKIKNNKVYNIAKDEWTSTNCQGYLCEVGYYKNGFEKATDEQIKLFYSKKVS
jgi:hypothetical protein